MAEKRQILIEIRKGSPIRRISRELRVHRDIIRMIQATAAKQGWLHSDSEIPSEGDIANVLKSIYRPTLELDKYLEQIKQWKSEGYTAVVIKQLLVNQHECPVRIGALRRYINCNCQLPPDPVMVRSTSPGKIMDVDFGFLGYLWDDLSKKFRKAWVFSGRLRHSRKAYRKIVWKQDISTFLMCHIYSFEHFGGIPYQVVSDNLKAAVIKSTTDNDMLNRSYLELAENYGFMISPCLPRTPEHKGGVENDIKYIKRNFWPQIREVLKNDNKFSLQQAQVALEKWDREIANTRQIQGIKRSPEEIFAVEEKQQLKALPENRWELVTWIQCKVGRDWRIMYEGSYYSVPYMMIGQTVQCRITYHFVEIYFEFNMIAKHSKAEFKGAYQRNADHAPPFKEAVLNCSREGLLVNAQEVGKDVYEFCKKMLAEAYIDKLRPVRMLLSLALNYEALRLNNACKRALKYKTFSYRSVKDILEKGLDFEPVQPSSIIEIKEFRYARDPKQYKSQ
ncbi:MAG: IS21 family transposase [Parachlamydiaceae bacterium]|nr:IS21 family transposase [Parachlamydiaceae bacterium]